MNTRTILLGVLCLTLVFTSCKKKRGKENTLPESFTVEVPASMTNTIDLSAYVDGDGGRSTETENLGASIYQMLGVFVSVGKNGAETVDAIVQGLKTHQIDRKMSVDYTGDDERKKSLVVTEDVAFEGETWGLNAVVTDIESNETAMQVFWTPGEKKGIAIIKLYALNQKEHSEMPNTMYRVDYSEVEAGYEQQMIVSLVAETPTEEWGIDRLKLFVGKNGNNYDIFGNSNHPDVDILDTKEDRNYTFVAKSDDSKGISVAKVAIPSSTITTNTHTMLEDNSIAEVIKGLFWADIDTINANDATMTTLHATIDEYTANAEQPAYFRQTAGFVGAGKANQPSDFSDDFVDLSGLNAYVPKEVRDLVLSFN